MLPSSGFLMRWAIAGATILWKRPSPNELNPYVLPLYILLMNGENLASLYLGPYTHGWNKYLVNMVQPVGRYDVVTPVHSCFLQMVI